MDVREGSFICKEEQMDITIRSYEMQDAIAVASLIAKELGYNHSTQQQVIARLRRFQVHPDYHMLVALNQREIIGFVGLHKSMAYDFDEEYIEITALAVQEAYRNEKVARELLLGVEGYAQKRCIHRIVMNSRLETPDAELFYKQSGYEEKGYTFTKKI